MHLDATLYIILIIKARASKRAARFNFLTLTDSIAYVPLRAPNEMGTVSKDLVSLWMINQYLLDYIIGLKVK